MAALRISMVCCGYRPERTILPPFLLQPIYEGQVHRAPCYLKRHFFNSWRAAHENWCATILIGDFPVGLLSTNSTYTVNPTRRDATQDFGLPSTIDFSCKLASHPTGVTQSPDDGIHHLEMMPISNLVGLFCWSRQIPWRDLSNKHGVAC